MSLNFNNNKNTWAVEEETTGYTLTSNDFKSFSKTWKEVIASCLYTSANLQYNSLVINDGSQLIYNSIVTPGEVTIVDPYAYEYTQDGLNTTLSTVPFKNVTDALGNTRKLTLIDETFEEAYEDCLYKNKYDLIFLNVKSEEDLHYKNIEKYFMLLEDYGCFFLQVPSNIEMDEQAKVTLEHYFSYLSIRIRSSSTGHSQSFIVYRKIQGLI